MPRPLDQVARFGWHPVSILSRPLDVASNGIGHGCAYPLSGDDFVQGSLQVVGLHFGGIARIIRAAAGIDEFSLLVEDIKIRRPECAVSLCYILAFVTEIDPGKIILLHPFHHIVEIIFPIGLFAVGIDTNKGNALILEAKSRCAGDFIRAGYVRTVITGKKTTSTLAASKLARL